MRTRGGNGRLHASERGLRSNQPAHTLISDSSLQAGERMNVPCLSRPVRGTLSQPSEHALTAAGELPSTGETTHGPQGGDEATASRRGQSRRLGHRHCAGRWYPVSTGAADSPVRSGL